MKLVSKYVLQLPDPLPSGADLVRAIQNHPELLGIPHSKLDCQAAVEKALALVGVIVNFRGSNHMWREMVHDRMSIQEARALDGTLTPGMICFHLKYDGSEQRRGYHDDMGAAVHVGVILDDETVFHSGARGTEIVPLNKTTFNMVSLCDFLRYPEVEDPEVPELPPESWEEDGIPDDDELTTMITQLRTKIQECEDTLNRLEQLYNYNRKEADQND